MFAPAGAAATSQPKPTPTAQGGANQITAVQGRLNEKLFNGRFRVSEMKLTATPASGAPSKTTYSLEALIANGQTLPSHEVDVVAYLASTNGESIGLDQAIYYVQVPPLEPGAAKRVRFRFATADKTFVPTKILLDSFSKRYPVLGRPFRITIPAASLPAAQ